VQITARVIAGADDVGDLHFEEIDFMAAFVTLEALLVKAA
jgi:hypothetical protein